MNETGARMIFEKLNRLPPTDELKLVPTFMWAKALCPVEDIQAKSALAPERVGTRFIASVWPTGR